MESVPGEWNVAQRVPNLDERDSLGGRSPDALPSLPVRAIEVSQTAGREWEP